MGLSIEEQKAVDRFKTAVVEPSMTKLVILDFWAEWCGPCKALTPMLEKVAAEYADKGVVLVKVNVDEEQFIASQFQVQSIPTVFAIYQGQPIADLTQARAESQLTQMLDQLLEKIKVDPGTTGDNQGPSADDIAKMVAMGDEALGAGNHDQAMQAYAQVMQFDQENGAAIGGLIRTQVAVGQADEAQAMLDQIQQSPVYAKIKDDPAMVAAISALDLASTKVDDGELANLRTAAADNPADMSAQFAYAEAAFAAGERDPAADTLLSMIETDRDWNDGAAKAKLLQIFEAVGLEDEWVSATRRRLSKLLFG